MTLVRRDGGVYGTMKTYKLSTLHSSVSQQHDRDALSHCGRVAVDVAQLTGDLRLTRADGTGVSLQHLVGGHAPGRLCDRRGWTARRRRRPRFWTTQSCPQEAILGRPDERAGLSHDLNVTTRGRLVVVVHGTSSDRWCPVATAQGRDARGVDVVTFGFSRPFDVDTVVMHTELLVLRGATVDVCWQVVGCGIGILRKRGPDLAGHWNITDKFQARLAAVGCLAASRLSVRSLAHSSGCDIEAVPLALSEMGSKAPEAPTANMLDSEGAVST